MVQGVDLERLYDIKVIEGSNPSLSVFLFSKLFNKKSRYGGIGRRTSLRGLRVNTHPGSSPGNGIKKQSFRERKTGSCS